MRTKRLSFIQRSALRLAGSALSLAGIAVVASPSEAQASFGEDDHNHNNQCNVDWDCFDSWDKVSWCSQGQCKSRDRFDEACKLPGEHNRCWWDGACNDGNPNTVNWCEGFGWNIWNFFGGDLRGYCYSAPKDGSACDPGNQPECRRNRDCRDNDPRTKNWCHEGQCYEADRNDDSCVETGSHCYRKRDCRDGDAGTFDWCFRGQCYHAPVAGGSCEPGTGCVEADCPDDGNECTQAACENDECAQQVVADGTACDNGAGACNAGVCQPVVTCDPSTCPDDGNECTQADCVNDACAQVNVNNGTECDNGNGSCNDGTCEPVVNCVEADCPDDGNECTAAACVNDACAQVNVNNGTECDGGNGSCNEGTCEPVVTCDPATCPSDGNECTQAACDSNDQCVQENVNNGTSCNNGNGTCSDGACVQCTEASDCNDGNECTSSACSDSGECQFMPVADGGSCNGGAGVCIAGACADVCEPANCPDDGNDCTESICNADNSCGTQPVAAGNLCAGGTGTCDASGTCSVCMPSDCNDNNECTDESCNGANCESNNAPDGRSCDNGNGVCSAGECVACIADSDCSDANACNGAETCVNFECVAGTAVECAPQECKVGSCTEPNGDCNYTNAPDGGSCANGSGTCQAGECNVCVAENCDDQNECTVDACDGANCSNTNEPDGTSCANGSGTCEAGQCNVCEDSSCNDNNECTEDACDGATCAFNPVSDGTECDNGNGVCSAGACVACIADSDCGDELACNGTEVCVNNVCQSGTAVECTPQDCKTVSCTEPSGECVYENEADNTVCADGSGLCIAGECTVCDPSSCQDSNECTASECDGSNQCVNNPVANGTPCNSNQGQCNDGACVECVADSDCAATTCTQAGTCVNNSCVEGAPIVCADDGNECTVESCDPVAGCNSTPVADGTSCTSNGADGTCQAGTCEVQVVPPPDCEPITVVLEHDWRIAVDNPRTGGRWRPPGDGYQVRARRIGDRSRSLTCWDTASLSGQVVQAYVQMSHSTKSFDPGGEDGISPNDESETVAFVPFDQVGCNNPEIRNGPASKPANHQQIFDDLRDGPEIAEFVSTAADNVQSLPVIPGFENRGQVETFPLNDAGIAALQSALGNAQGFGIGGFLKTPPTSGNAEQRVFRGTDDSGGRPQPSTKLVIVLKPDSCGADTVVVPSTDGGHFVYGLQSPDGFLESLSAKYISNDGSTERYIIGAQKIGPDVFERRGFAVWDVGSINNAVSAKFRIWEFRNSAKNVVGGYQSSVDPTETVGLFSLNNFTAQQVSDRPAGQTAIGDDDDGIFADLGTGTIYGERVYSNQDNLVGLSPGFLSNLTAADCSPANGGQPADDCGKWFEYDLNADAVAAINASNGLFGFGMAVTTIGADSGEFQRVHSSIRDLKKTKTSVYPEFIPPKPQLIIKTAN